MRPLTAARTARLEEKEIALRTRREYREAWIRLAVPADATFTGLPTLLAAHRLLDLNALYKRVREVSGYLREDTAALEALVGELVMLRVVTTAGRERKSPQKSP